jgi:hypothetical protein
MLDTGRFCQQCRQPFLPLGRRIITGLNYWLCTLGGVRYIVAVDSLVYAPRACGPPIIAARLAPCTTSTSPDARGTTGSARPTVVSMSLERSLYNTKVVSTDSASFVPSATQQKYNSRLSNGLLHCSQRRTDGTSPSAISI